ncbi:MAG: dTMP kinase [Candidatus Pelagibacter sp. TMED273]|nr:MAG: dTMP kinase [Candidatus Pelagibacter sp. TMED273]
MMKNKFISFEGVDGVGKTTQINLFLEKLQSLNLNYHLYREPGGTKLSESIREILLDNNNHISNLTESLLFLTARSDLVNKKIKPKVLENDSFIICDRFFDSTLAYQSYGREINKEFIQLITDQILQNIIPSTTFLLDCDINISINRLSSKDRMENSGLEFLKKVKEGFLELALLDKNRYVIIDANKSISDIEKSIWTHFKKRYIK